MSLLDTIGKMFSRSYGKHEPTTSDEMKAAALNPSVGVSGLAHRMMAETDRRNIIHTCRDMYRTDPRARRVLSTLARDSIRGGFTVKVKGDKDAEQTARDAIARLKLTTQLVEWIRLTLRDGDTFLELSINGNREICKATRKPTMQMHRQSNAQDEFDDPRKAFWVADPLWLLPDPPMDAVWFAEWQIVHARWDHDEENRYGWPLFSSATGAYKRVKEGEVDIAVRRKTRAGMKYLHKFPLGTDPSVIEAYKEQNKDSLDNPFSAVADFFGTPDINVVQGDAHLQEIADVLHHINSWWTASPVPMSLIGYGQNINRDILEKQKEQYEEELDPITQWVEDDFVVPILERQWLLAGILPESLNYEVEWTTKGKLEAANIRDVADALLRLKALGVGQDVLLSILTRFLPGYDVSAQTLGDTGIDAGGSGGGGRGGGASRVASGAGGTW